MTFVLPELTYAYDALEPAIDATTMEIHHSKHHAGYITKLNNAIASLDEDEERTEIASRPIEQLMTQLPDVPEEIRDAVRNNGGGHYNHSLFRASMTPGGSAMPQRLTDRIVRDFGSVQDFMEMFASAAASRFGSGRAWLVIDGDKLVVESTPNQDNPLMDGRTPILGLDVWEHAYYLAYQNKRPDYITAWWSVVDRVAVDGRRAEARR